MTSSPSSLEREIAYLTWTMRSRRVDSRASAIRANAAARSKWISGKDPVYTLETRVGDLIEELKSW